MAKYIVHNRGIMPESMVIFDEATVHKDMARALRLQPEDIISAGKLYISSSLDGDGLAEADCVMMSESLSIRQDRDREKKDTLLANRTFKPHR